MSGENDPIKQPIKKFVPTGYEQPFPLEKWHRHMLRTQHRHDRRMHPPRYLWRLQVDSIEPNSTYEEVPDAQRIYAGPHAAMFMMNSNPSRYELEKWGIERKADSSPILCEMSEAERLRLATVFAPDDPSVWTRWRPNPGDLFFFGGRLYQVEDFRGKLYYGNTNRVAVWIMPATGYRTDSAHLQWPVTPPEEDPQVQPWPLLGNGSFHASQP
jgi:hypothetical protein